MSTEIIIGAGPVGLSLALMRAHAGAQVTLLDKTPLAVAQVDARHLALSLGSQQIVQQLGVTHLAHAPIAHIHISEQGAWGHTPLHADALAQPMLGMVVRYGELVAQLSQLAQQQPRIRIIRPALIAQVDDKAVHLDDGTILTAELIVHAEGVNAPVQVDYQQTALIADVRLSRAQPAWAWERFTPNGPCALLPISSDGLHFNLVWCLQRERAEVLQTVSEAEFLQQLNQTMHHLTGKIVHTSSRSAFPLGLQRAEPLHSSSRIAIGNAAQTLHPVAGQGFNLGLRDAVVLNQSLQQQPTIVQAIGAFLHHRQLDRAITSRTTDVLARGFTDDFGLKHLRSVGFGLLNALPFVQRKVAEQFMFGVR
ncbi:MAG: FAD-dependent monooxygenase [Formosimonas sp.]